MNNPKALTDLLQTYLMTGLIDRNVEKFLNCFARRFIGIGMGEQGFVTCLDDIRGVFDAGMREGDTSTYTLDFGRTETLMLGETVALICAEVMVNCQPSHENAALIKTQFQQSLTVTLEDGEWKVCGLHASAPIITEEDVAAYPLKFAEKTLLSLKEKFGEEVSLAEEQYRKAVLSDTIAFYIINFSTNLFEKCELQNELCICVDTHTAYEDTVRNKNVQYVLLEDREKFVNAFCLESIMNAFLSHSSEISLEYRMICPDLSIIWVKTIIRLITDVITGEKKGIMYVKNIDEEKRAAQSIEKKANYDSMTKLLHKGAMISAMEHTLREQRDTCPSTFIMVDVDDFKAVNDSFGHPVGDKVLITLAQMLKDAFGETACIGRLGGDEFGVFLYNQQLDEPLRQRLEELLRKISHIDFTGATIGAGAFSISVSIGGTCLTETSFEKFYEAADIALYEAKRKGKNTAAFC